MGKYDKYFLLYNHHTYKYMQEIIHSCSYFILISPYSSKMASYLSTVYYYLTFISIKVSDAYIFPVEKCTRYTHKGLKMM